MRASTAIGVSDPTRETGRDCSAPSSLACICNAEVPDFIEKQRATGRDLEPPGAVLPSVGECAFLVAEQLRLEQRFSNGAEIDVNERAGGAR